MVLATAVEWGSFSFSSFEIDEEVTVERKQDVVGGVNASGGGGGGVLEGKL